MTMTIDDPYVTLAEAKASLSMGSQTYLDADLTLALLAASRGIDSATGRRFYPDTDVNQVRYYTPDSERILMIDDVITLTQVALDRAGSGTFDEVWTNNTEFVLGPLNAAAESAPYEYVQVRRFGIGSRSSYRNSLPLTDRGVKVTAKFGWSAVPAEIKVATSIIASRLVKRVREAPFGVVFSGGIDSTAAIRIAKTDPDVAPIIAQFTRHRPIV